jgi:pyruvate dehydrogenase E2 component (dihydrolipoyllysine-residue acetyltransferase)
MNVEMRMPDLATTGSPIKVVRWLVEVGQSIRRGEPLLEVETDKAVMQVESVVTGHLSSLSVREGDEVEAGKSIAVFETDQAPVAAAARKDEVPTTALMASTLPVLRDGEKAAVAGHRQSFFARNAEARASRARGRTQALSVPQRVLAHRMEESKRTIPHFYLQTSANAERMAARRKAAAGEPIAWDAFFVHAAGKALRKFDRLSCRFEDDRLVSQGVDAVGLAVDLDGDLFTLAIDHPADKGVEEISREIAKGVQRLRSGDPRARMAQPAALTVSNLGGSGIESFAAVINPTESAILALGKVMPVVTAVDGMIAIQNRVTLTVSVDHRVASGKYAAEFLAAVVQELERV